MIVRKNQKFMTPSEKNCFINAFQAVRAGFLEGVDKPRLLEFVDEHGRAFSKFQSTTHGTQFFAWHRSHLRAFEKRLRKVDRSVFLPFWNPFDDDYPRWLLDVPNVNRGNDLAVSDLSAVPWTELAFERFQGSVNTGFHSQVHGQLGGAMANPGRANRDPVFWLHHNNIDRVWSMWTESRWSATPGVDGHPEYRPDNRGTKLAEPKNSGTLSERDIGDLIFSVDRGYVFGSGMFNDLKKTGTTSGAITLEPGLILSFDTGSWQAKAKVTGLTRNEATFDVRLYGNWKPVRDYPMTAEDTGHHSLIKNGLTVAESAADIKVVRKIGKSYTYTLHPINGTKVAIYEGREPFERLTP